jgi:hypothetical protein
MATEKCGVTSATGTCHTHVYIYIHGMHSTDPEFCESDNTMWNNRKITKITNYAIPSTTECLVYYKQTVQHIHYIQLII